MDKDNEFGRLSLGKDITRPRKMTNILTDNCRSRCKQIFQSGCYSPWEYINAVSQTIGNIRDLREEVKFSDCSEDSETDDIDNDNNNHQNCVVCLNSRTSTWIFLPCRQIYVELMPTVQIRTNAATPFKLFICCYLIY